MNNQIHNQKSEPTTYINGNHVFAYHHYLGDDWILCNQNTGVVIMTGTKKEIMEEYERIERDGKI